MKYKALRSKFFLFLLICIAKISFSQVPADSTAAADSALLKQVEQQMQGNNSQATQQPQQRRSSLTFNPDIGVIGDFQGYYTSKGKKNFDAYLNETEVSSRQQLIHTYGQIFFFHLPATRNREVWSRGRRRIFNNPFTTGPTAIESRQIQRGSWKNQSYSSPCTSLH